MLFNSYEFLLAFLPMVFAVHTLLRSQGLDRSAIAFLTIASFAFYGWWNPVYLLLIGALILANYALVQAIIRLSAAPRGLRRAVLVLAIVANLCVLGYFKYVNFFIDNLNALFGLDLFVAQVVLPLGISFFTFQKIALLADAYEGKIRDLNFLDYALFVLFFPQLIAGPIVHHSEAMPQFQARGRVPMSLIALGITIFAIGLSKKVILADGAAIYAAPQFDAAASGAKLSFLDAWSGALAYSLQLYFDFSGYSDMAIGAALLFGVRLPLNFNSPYKARSMIDFWRRWHMTLSRFLRDYLYIPLGGNRRGRTSRYLNLFATMVLGGLWHGAGWTFIVWGALHGVYLGINHAWEAVRGVRGRGTAPSDVRRLAGQALTFLAVVIAWVFFRANDLPTAFAMLQAMAAINDLSPLTEFASQKPAGLEAFLVIGLLLSLVWLAPNTQELVAYVPPLPGFGLIREHEIPRGWLRWRPSPRWAVLVGCLVAASLMSLSKVSEFLYFQF
jgi:alginate O-acetyltransferase complex protein AlgI